MEKVYKRKFREMDESTKKKISEKMKGRKMSPETKKKLSEKMKAYWNSIPSKNDI